MSKKDYELIARTIRELPDHVFTDGGEANRPAALRGRGVCHRVEAPMARTMAGEAVALTESEYKYWRSDDPVETVKALDAYFQFEEAKA